MDGHGTEDLKDGDKYVGEWIDGLKHGKGTLFFSDGGEYVGEFKDGEQHGHGILTYSNGEMLVGDFVMDYPFIFSSLDKDEDPTILIERAIPAIRKFLKSDRDGTHILV